MSQLIDARGPRFGAAVTSLVLATAFLLPGSATATALLILQAAAFGAAAFFGIKYQPYGRLFARFVAPRLAPATQFEAPEPPRFAQLVGFGFAIAALAGVALGSSIVTATAVGFALLAALMNAVFAFCLGCEIYLLARRLAPANALAGQ